MNESDPPITAVVLTTAVVTGQAFIHWKIASCAVNGDSSISEDYIDTLDIKLSVTASTVERGHREDW